jgi:hypothetical protein
MAHTNYTHTIDQVELDATAIGGLTRGSARAGITVHREGSSGDPHARHQSITERKPVASWESYALKSWLSAVGLAGKEIDSLTSGLKLYLKKVEHGGTRATGSNHIKYTITSGIILPRRLTVRHRQPGSISYDALVTYDGANAVIQKTESAALPGSLTDDQRYALGPITWAGQSYVGVKELDLDFGLTEILEGADSDIDDTEAAIADVKPEITLRGINPKWFGASYVPIGGLALGHATTSIYLRRYKAGGEIWANGQAKHVKMTVAGLAFLEDVFSADHNRPAETALKIPLEYDGTNAQIVFTFDTTIP